MTKKYETRQQRAHYRLRGASKYNLKHTYSITLMVSLLLALAILWTAFRFFPTNKTVEGFELDVQETIAMEDVLQTEQIEQAPPPPVPPIPIEVANDEILEDDVLDLDASLDLDDAPLPLPPPPSEPVEEEDEPDIFFIVEQQPEPIGGVAAIKNRAKYPDLCNKAGIEGRVSVQFVVNEQGDVEDANVIRGIFPACDEEALRVVREAKFIPGKQRGKAVKVRMTIPIDFTLK